MQLNGHLGGWFPVKAGVRQGDSLSPVLFSIFINDLAQGVSDLKQGINIGDDRLDLLLYADDIVLISKDVKGAQQQLDFMTTWCSQWGMAINAKKSQVMHIRHHHKPRNKTPLNCCGQRLEYVSTYKYLGYHMHEHLSHHATVKILTSSAKRAFGLVVNKFKKLGDMGHKTFETLFNTNIIPIANYGASLWGFKDYPEARQLQLRAGRFYIGTHRFTPLAAVNTELDWLEIKYVRWIDMVRLKNRILSMPDHKWPKQVWLWDIATNTKAWYNDISYIIECAGLDPKIESTIDTDLELLYSKFLD